MELYNKIMTKVWLLVAIVVFVLTTYMCVTEDYRQWAFYYVIVVVALLMYFVKRWMMKRMTKHMEYLEEKKKNG